MCGRMELHFYKKDKRTRGAFGAYLARVNCRIIVVSR